MRTPLESSEKLKQTHLLIVDETPTLSCNAVRAVDLQLRNLTDSPRTFGGNCTYLSKVSEFSFKQSLLRDFLTKHGLTENMRKPRQYIFNECFFKINFGHETFPLKINIWKKTL